MQNKSTPQRLIDFYLELSQVFLSEEVITFKTPSPETLNRGQEKATPLINLCPPKVKVSDFFTVMKQVATIIQKYHLDLVTEIEQIEKALPADPAAQELFVAQVFVPGNNLLTYLEQDVSPDTFDFLLNHTLKPFMKKYGKMVASFYNFEQWQKGNCPICGGWPSLAFLEKDTGKRHLYCGLCKVEWRFQRMGCPYCLNGESQFFTVEGFEKYRVYFCEKCRGYLKTVNAKGTDGKEVNLFWEDINTIHLDLVAMHEGYLNKQIGPSLLKEVEK